MGSTLILQIKTGSSMACLRNDGMRNACHIKEQFIFETCVRSCVFNKVILVYKVNNIKQSLVYLNIFTF
jgi:hypothetical protein